MTAARPEPALIAQLRQQGVAGARVLSAMARVPRKLFVPEALLEQLAEGGIMVIPVDAGHNLQELLKISRTPEGYERQSIMPVRFVPLVEGLPREAFQKD